MIEIKTEYPYIDDNGEKNSNIIKTYAEDENSVRYKIKQIETGIIYDEAVDIYPCRYTYVATDIIIETTNLNEMYINQELSA